MLVKFGSFFFLWAEGRELFRGWNFKVCLARVWKVCVGSSSWMVGWFYLKRDDL